MSRSRTAPTPARALVRRTALGFLQYPDGVDWDGETVYLCIPIAASGDEHVGVLSALAEILVDDDSAAALRAATDVETVLALLNPGDHAAEERPRMKVARFYAPGDIRIEDAPEPSPGPAEVKIRVRNCSTCGTDVKIYQSGHQNIDPPRIMGHEIAGEVVEIGADVGPPSDGRPWAVGDRVQVIAAVPDGTCPGLPARLDDDLPEPDVDRLPVRGRLRRVPHRSATRCCGSTA